MSDQKKSPILIIALVAVVAIAAGAWFLNRETSEPVPTEVASSQDGSQASAVGGRDDLFLGQADAPIEVIEYASFTCPHCAAFHEQVYPNLKAEYIDTGKVKFVMREVYFDRFGLAAGLLARCGGDMRYFGIVDLLFKKQSEWARGENDQIIQNLYKIGRQAGLADDAMQACVGDRELSEALIADFQLKAGADDINSTPSFVIDGEKAGNMSWNDFKALLDEKLK